MTECVADHGCITCGDVAIPMRIVRIDSRRSLALCAAADGARETVEIALVAPVQEGEWLLVHAGTALSRPAAPDAAAMPGAGATLARAARPDAAPAAQETAA